MKIYAIQRGKAVVNSVKQNLVVLKEAVILSSLSNSHGGA